MSKKSWIKIDYGSSIDLPVSEIFMASHSCDRNGDTYFSNALLGQHTGLTYRRRDDITEIKFQCQRCRSRFIAQVHGNEMNRIPAFPDWAYAKARDSMFERGCMHSRNWMLSPVVLDEDDNRIRIIMCSTCDKRVRFDW